MHIDQSVYPDLDDPPRVLDTPYAKADYLHRVCAAWDYGVFPDAETLQVFANWEEIFERFPVLTSPAYHTMRAWFGWHPLPFPSHLRPPTPRWVELDLIEGRDADPCQRLI